MARLTLTPVLTTTSRFTVAKPVRATTSWYFPGSTFRKRKSPWLPLVVVRVPDLGAGEGGGGAGQGGTRLVVGGPVDVAAGELGPGGAVQPQQHGQGEQGSLHRCFSIRKWTRAPEAAGPPHAPPVPASRTGSRCRPLNVSDPSVLAPVASGTLPNGCPRAGRSGVSPRKGRHGGGTAPARHPATRALRASARTGPLVSVSAGRRPTRGSSSSRRQ